MVPERRRPCRSATLVHDGRSAFVSAPSAPFLRADRLPPDPSSPGRARTFVTEVLRAADREDDAEVAALLVSETVTNAVLHAGTDLEVRCRVTGEVVRIEVRDGSSVLPGLRHYDGRRHDRTGPRPGAGPGPAPGASSAIRPARRCGSSSARTRPRPHPPLLPPRPRRRAATAVIRLLAVPVGLVRRTVEYGDAVLREVALLAATDGPDAGPALRAPQLDLTPILEPVDAAWEAGEATVDLEIDLPGRGGHRRRRAHGPHRSGRASRPGGPAPVRPGPVGDRGLPALALRAGRRPARRRARHAVAGRTRARPA